MRLRRFFKGIALALTGALLLTVFALIVVLVFTPPPPQQSRRSALIIDSLYEWMPNEDVIKYMVDALSKVGYEVTVIKGRQADVAAFSNLSLYDLVVIRCHGAYLSPGESLGGRVLSDYAPVVFTGEIFSECLPFSCKYYLERLREEVIRGDFQVGESTVSVFALTPVFFEDMGGNFRKGSVVIVASCYGLSGRTLADVLIRKGVSFYISWDWKVSPHHMDESLKMLVEEALVKGRGWVEAVEVTAGILGPDPLGGGKLKIVAGGEGG
ncbi:MAG: hypothetical protein NZ954_03615 [Thermofilaceae archaeon]|nr:hypothetical protein [Thermofilaceae archaeon]